MPNKKRPGHRPEPRRKRPLVERQPFKFMNLAVELRLKICHYVLWNTLRCYSSETAPSIRIVKGRPYIVNIRGFPLLLTCKQLAAEILPWLVGESVLLIRLLHLEPFDHIIKGIITPTPIPGVPSLNWSSLIRSHIKSCQIFIMSSNQSWSISDSEKIIEFYYNIDVIRNELREFSKLKSIELIVPESHVDFCALTLFDISKEDGHVVILGGRPLPKHLSEIEEADEIVAHRVNTFRKDAQAARKVQKIR